MIDVVFPENNENEFVEIALKLGIKELYFIYNFDNYNNEKTDSKISQKTKQHNIQIEIGVLVNNKNVNEAFKLSRFLIAKSSDNDRRLIESKKIKLIYGFEEINRKDYLHQRASGLNHILCELAKKNNVAIGFSYSSLFNKDNITSTIILGRMIQNIKLCGKYKVQTAIGSFSSNPYDLRAPYDIKNLFNILKI